MIPKVIRSLEQGVSDQRERFFLEGAISSTRPSALSVGQHLRDPRTLSGRSAITSGAHAPRSSSLPVHRDETPGLQPFQPPIIHACNSVALSATQSRRQHWILNTPGHQVEEVA